MISTFKKNNKNFFSQYCPPSFIPYVNITIYKRNSTKPSHLDCFLLFLCFEYCDKSINCAQCDKNSVPCSKFGITIKGKDIC